MSDLLAYLSTEQFIAEYGVWAVFVLVGLENVGLPLPGEIILVTAAVLAGTANGPNILAVIFMAVAGSVLGAMVGYWVGREFGFPLLLRHGRRLGIGESQLKLGQYLFLLHGVKVVFFGRMLAVLRILAAVLAGVNCMPWRQFLFATFCGGAVWASLFGGGGYILGRQAQAVTGPIGVAGIALAVLAAFIGLRFLHGHQRVLQEAAERAFPEPLDGQRRDRGCS